MIEGVEHLLRAGISGSSDTDLMSSVEVSPSTMLRRFPEKSNKRSYVAILRDLILKQAWQRLCEVLASTQSIEEFLETAYSVTMENSPPSRFVLFACGYGRGRATSLRSDELRLFNAEFDKQIAREGSKHRIDAVRETLFGALSQLIWMHYLSNKGDTKDAAVYSKRDAVAVIQQMSRSLLVGDEGGLESVNEPP